jgi:diacylglycerol kinase (ATP)
MTQMDDISTGFKHALVVYFPGSGRAGDLNKNLGRIIRRLTEEGGFTVSSMVLTDYEFLKQMVAETRADIIVGVGGDGTIRRVLEAVVLSGTKIPVGIVPLGTGNLLAKSLGLVAKGTIDKVENALDIILNGRTASMDLGKANDKIFAIDVGVGPLANAVIAPKPGQKSRWKMFAYLRPFMLSMRKRPVDFSIELDGQPSQVQASGIFITNEREMGLTTEPGDLTSLRDGKMYVYIVNPRGFGAWMKVAWATAIAWYTNSSLEYMPYERKIARHTVRVDSDKLSGYMMDGDRCAHTPLEVELLPSAVTIFVPQWAKKGATTRERHDERRLAA